MGFTWNFQVTRTYAELETIRVSDSEFWKRRGGVLNGNQRCDYADIDDLN